MTQSNDHGSSPQELVQRWSFRGGPAGRTARSLIAVLTCTAVLAACSGGKDTSSTKGPADGGTSVATTIAPSGSSDGATGATTTTGSSTGLVDAPGVEGAQAALDSYLDAIAANDYATALAVSSDALRSLTIVRSIVHTGNAERGGTTRSTYERRSFDVGPATAEEVRFDGQATLTSTVSGPSGPSVATTDTFSSVAVRRGPDGWRVADATYNGAPLRSFPAAAGASTTSGPVRVTLTGAVAFGSSLAVVVQLVADGDHTVEVGSDALRIDDEEAPSTARLVVGGQPGYAYLTYPRRDEQPTEWHATVTVDGDAHTISLLF